MPAHSMRRSPPRVCTSTASSSQPSRMPATTAAHAPVPQASVSPAPRSYTRSFTSRRLITCRKPAFTRRGNASWFSTSGPTMATGAWSTSSTRCTACGLPIDSTATSAVMPSPRSSGQRWKPCSVLGIVSRGSKGMRGRSKTGAPMSTVTRPSSRRRSSSSALIVWTRMVRLSVSPLSTTKRTKQRAPLPHCSTSEPSELKMR